MNHRFLRLTLLLLLLFVLDRRAEATHLHGQDAWYKYLGSSRYKVYFGLYQDYTSGDGKSIYEDQILFVSVFDAEGHLLRQDTTTVDTVTRVPDNAAGTCASSLSTPDVRYIVQSATITLPLSETGYIVKVQRCCIGNNIDNIKAPLENGLELRISIPGTNAPGSPEFQNHSPVFTPVVKVTQCVNSRFRMAFGATDADGDSLAYRPDTVMRGGSPNNAKPQSTSIYGIPVLYNPGYGPSKPFGDAGSMSLNSVTGLADMFCNNIGKYMISVACDEYRNGRLLGTIHRSIVVQIVPCGYEVQARIAVDSAALYSGIPELGVSRCNGRREVTFENRSTGADSYSWDFGDGTTNADTSHDTNPVYTYPQAARYAARLIATGANCSDTMYFQVWIDADTVLQDFRFNGRACVGNMFSAEDQSSIPSGRGASYRWLTIAGAYTGPRVPLSFDSSGIQQVREVVISDGGCITHLAKAIAIESAGIGIESDTIVKKQRLVRMRATGGEKYRWDDNPYVVSPLDEPELLLRFEDVMKSYPVVVNGTSSEGCKGRDTAFVTVTENGYYFVPNAFTPNGDGLNDVLTPLFADYVLMRFSVFDRRGMLLFSTQQAGSGWDGSHGGKKQIGDTYHWVLDLQNPDGTPYSYSGETLLIR